MIDFDTALRDEALMEEFLDDLAGGPRCDCCGARLAHSEDDDPYCDREGCGWV